jgi:hypothetical protein
MTPNEIISLIGEDGIIAKEQVLAWMQEKDLELRGAVYELTSKAWNRIQPEPTMEEQCNFMLQYLLDCIRENNHETEWSHTGFEAAWELASWFKHLNKLPEAEGVIINAAQKLTAMYRAGDDDLKNRIATGALEHIFEVKKLRKYFDEWRSDPELKEEYETCAGWGNAHTKAPWNKRNG